MPRVSVVEESPRPSVVDEPRGGPVSPPEVEDPSGASVDSVPEDDDGAEVTSLPESVELDVIGCPREALVDEPRVGPAVEEREVVEEEEGAPSNIDVEDDDDEEERCDVGQTRSEQQ